MWPYDLHIFLGQGNEFPSIHPACKFEKDLTEELPKIYYR